MPRYIAHIERVVTQGRNVVVEAPDQETAEAFLDQIYDTVEGSSKLWDNGWGNPTVSEPGEHTVVGPSHKGRADVKITEAGEATVL